MKQWRAVHQAALIILALSLGPSPAAHAGLLEWCLDKAMGMFGKNRKVSSRDRLDEFFLEGSKIELLRIPSSNVASLSSSDGKHFGQFSGRLDKGSYHAMTDLGAGYKYKDVNQDAVGVVHRVDGRTLLISLDGMGGVEGGQIATDVVMKSSKARYARGESWLDSVRESAGDLETHWRDQLGSPQKTRDMGMTVAVSEIVGNQLSTTRIGDSRVLVIDAKGQLRLRTRDQTAYWEFFNDIVDRVAKGEKISDEQALHRVESTVLAFKREGDKARNLIAKYLPFKTYDEFVNGFQNRVASMAKERGKTEREIRDAFMQRARTRDEKLMSDEDYRELWNYYGKQPNIVKGSLGLDEGRGHLTMTEAYKVLLNQDDWVIQGSDGLFDALTHQEIQSIVSGSSSPEAATARLREAVRQVVAKDKSADDNINIVVYQHRRPPAPSEADTQPVSMPPPSMPRTGGDTEILTRPGG